LHYREALAGHGLQITGVSPDGALVEVIEIPSHPWFVAVQCHPEFKSKPTLPHPLFREFIGAGLQRRREKRGLVVATAAS